MEISDLFGQHIHTDFRTKAHMMNALKMAAYSPPDAEEATKHLLSRQKGYRKRMTLAEMKRIFTDKWLPHALIVFDREDLMAKGTTNTDDGT
jgi:hypothetical protein